MVFLRDEGYREDYHFTPEERVGLGREVMKLKLKAFAVKLLLAFVLLMALSSTMAGTPRYLGMRSTMWWGISAVALACAVALMRAIAGCPGCGRSLVGRNTYARECVRCGVPLSYFEWRRLANRTVR